MAFDKPTQRVEKPTEKMGQMDHFFYSALHGAETGMVNMLDSKAKVADITKKDAGGEFIDMSAVNKDNGTMSKYFASAGAAGMVDAKPDAAKQKGIKAADEWLANVA